MLVKDFVDGQTLSSTINGLLKGYEGGLVHVSSYGQVIASVHSQGIALGDSKPSNVVIGSAGLYLTDLEQAFLGGDRAWDIAEFLYYTAKLSTREDAMRRVAQTFLGSYAKSGNRDSAARARGQKYFGPFRPFLTPGMAKMLREMLSGYA